MDSCSENIGSVLEFINDDYHKKLIKLCTFDWRIVASLNCCIVELKK